MGRLRPSYDVGHTTFWIDGDGVKHRYSSDDDTSDPEVAKRVEVARRDLERHEAAYRKQEGWDQPSARSVSTFERVFGGGF